MVEIDVMTAYVICSAGSLVGAAMLRLVGERMRSVIATAAWDTGTESAITVTTSVGVVLARGSATLAEAMKRADEALYRAKGDGLNKVQVALNAA